MSMTADNTVGSNLPAGFGVLARILMSMLGLHVLVSIIAGFHALWGASTELNRIASDSDISAAQAFDATTRVLALAELGLLLVAGVIWLVWQRRLATAAAPGFLRRSPGWHVGSWFIPFASLVLPFQNMSDLWRAFNRPTVAGLKDPLPLWMPLWWLSWIFGNLIAYLTIRGSASPSLGQLQAGEWLFATSSALTSLAGVLAVVLVARLTAAATSHLETDATAAAIPV